MKTSGVGLGLGYEAAKVHLAAPVLTFALPCPARVNKVLLTTDEPSYSQAATVSL